ELGATWACYGPAKYLVLGGSPSWIPIELSVWRQHHRFDAYLRKWRRRHEACKGRRVVTTLRLQSLGISSRNIALRKANITMVPRSDGPEEAPQEHLGGERDSRVSSEVGVCPFVAPGDFSWNSPHLCAGQHWFCRKDRE